MKTCSIAQKMDPVKVPHLEWDKHTSGPRPHYEAVPHPTPTPGPELGCSLGSQV